MKSILSGVCLPIFACPGPHLFRTPGFDAIDPAAALAFGRAAEALGYDSLWVADHLMLGRDEAILEGWTVLAALAGATTRPRLGMIHQAHYFRHPSIAAKMAATIDQISGGRLIHFMDCGYQKREYVNFDMPWDDDLEVRAADLDEAIEMIVQLWTTDGAVTFEGRRWHVRDAICNPKPMQQPHPPLWFGEPNAPVLDLCARRGHGWNTTPVSISELERRLGLLREACARNGRDMDEIEISFETQILIAPDIPSLRETLRGLVERGGDQNHLPDEIAPFVHTYATDESTVAFLEGRTDDLPEPMATDWVIGTPEQVHARLDAYIRTGVSHFMFWFMDAPSLDGMRLLANDVLPAVRSPRPV
jgi:alkanesulfonate monooxygenase SsuD/methylene tetrahydromethanopterin reductase-like flavin-dependent oxidoreductase (luciferase family)